jgi:hypothetical protein
MQPQSTNGVDTHEKIVAVKHRNVAGRFLPSQIGSGGKVFHCAVCYEKSVWAEKKGDKRRSPAQQHGPQKHVLAFFRMRVQKRGFSV